ncbi:MAG: hypothetical protein H6725_15140 [Sandaracinaceae bacterium]|nr:hypothetical protein [Sandaracinaceae bacterium]
MHFDQVGTFAAAHGKLAWPWVAVNPARTAFAFATLDGQVATRVWQENALVSGTSFTLPADLRLPTRAAPPTGHRGVAQGIHGFAIDPAVGLLAVTGVVDGVSVLVTVDREGEQRRSRLDALAGGDFTAHALTFDRSGERLWVSAESGSATALLLLDPRSHDVLGVVESAPFPPPAFHELHLHPQDDAVLLLAACGQDGTFARVAGWSDGPPVSVSTALDSGASPAGFAGFSSDGTRVHLVEDAELRTHAWPDLTELSAAALADDFTSSYVGVVVGDLILLDGHDADTETEDRVMIFDRSALRGAVVPEPAPPGMWVGRLGADLLITVDPKGDPAAGHVVRVRV